MGIESNNSVGGQPGNQNAKKGKLWNDALRKAIAQNPHKLRMAAEKLLDEASEGNIMAIKEIGDRMDGKAVQTNTLETEDGKTVIPGFQLVFVEPKNE